LNFRFTLPAASTEYLEVVFPSYYEYDDAFPTLFTSGLGDPLARHG